MTSLPAVSMSSLQARRHPRLSPATPHVGIYVGHGYIIDAPARWARSWKKVPLAGWYQTELDGAVRP